MTGRKWGLLTACFALGTLGALLVPASAFAKSPPPPCNNGQCWLSGGDIVCVYRDNWICTFHDADWCESSGDCT